MDRPEARPAPLPARERLTEPRHQREVLQPGVAHITKPFTPPATLDFKYGAECFVIGYIYIFVPPGYSLGHVLAKFPPGRQAQRPLQVQCVSGGGGGGGGTIIYRKKAAHKKLIFCLLFPGHVLGEGLKKTVRSVTEKSG